MTTETLITEPAKTETATGAESGAAPSSQQANEQTATGAGEGGQQQQASEGQAGEGQQTEAAKTDDGQKKPDEPKGAPEQYAEFKAPEGVTFDTGVIGEFSKAAKELDLPQDKAQQLLDRMGPVMVARSAERLIAAAKSGSARCRRTRNWVATNCPRTWPLRKRPSTRLAPRNCARC